MPELLEQTQEELILAFLADGGDDFTSGEALSDKLGLSRAAVWKHVEGLRLKGYRIEALPARGYRLLGIPDRLTSLELTPLLGTQDLGRTVHAYDSLPSTNDAAFALATQGAAQGEVVIAEQQTQGKGRRGRHWISPPGLNLYVSVVLRPELPPQRAPELTLLGAVAVAETLRDAAIEAQIKWPNDVQVDGRKIAGILTELSADTERIRFAVLGIGINLNATDNDFPSDLRDTATSAQIVRGEPVPRVLFTAALLGSLERWLIIHADEGFEPVRARWKTLSSTLGQDVLVKSERSELQGYALDIDASGALLVRLTDGRIERVLSADVEQLRPRKSSTQSPKP